MPTALIGERFPALAPLPTMSAASNAGIPAPAAMPIAIGAMQRGRRDRTRTYSGDQADQHEEQRRQRAGTAMEQADGRVGDRAHRAVGLRHAEEHAHAKEREE